MKLLKYSLSIISLMVLLASCSEYQKILKNRDSEVWYQKGLEYYRAGDYARASNLLGGVMTNYRGTQRSDTIIMYYANSLVKLGDYYTAVDYFRNYLQTFPSSDNCEQCQYMCGYCYYMMSPKVLLDQSDTESAVSEFQTFLNLYPNSTLVPEVERMMTEMQNKLAEKDYDAAKLYFNLGDYMGNNYKSAVITAQNCLRKYPDTKFREELSFLILEAKFIQAERSVIEKQSERYRDAIDEYYSFANEFPQSIYSKRADNILARSEKGLAHAEKIAPPSQDDLEYFQMYNNDEEKRKELERKRAAQAWEDTY